MRKYGWGAGVLAVSGMLAVLPGCTAVSAGQLVQAGYDAAKTSLSNPSGGAAAEQARAVMNSLSVGQDVTPVLAAMGAPPKEKSGNLQGYVCYQYAAVYSATEDAVIVAKDSRIVFFGNSTCKSEMQAANFVADGKYAHGAIAPAAAGSPAMPQPATDAAHPGDSVHPGDATGGSTPGGSTPAAGADPDSP